MPPPDTTRRSRRGLMLLAVLPALAACAPGSDGSRATPAMAPIASGGAILAQAIPAQVGPAQAGPAQVGPAQVGPPAMAARDATPPDRPFFCASLAPPPAAVPYCTRSLGRVDCWTRPPLAIPLPPGVADGPMILTPAQERRRTECWPGLF